MSTPTVAGQDITGQEVPVLLQGALQEQLGVAAVQALALTRRAAAEAVGSTGAPAHVKLPAIQGAVQAVRPVLVHLQAAAAAQAILITALAPVKRLRRRDVITFLPPAVEVDFIGILVRVPAARPATHQLTLRPPLPTQNQAHLVQPAADPVRQATIGCLTAADGVCQMAQAEAEVLPLIQRQALPQPRLNRPQPPQPPQNLHRLLLLLSQPLHLHRHPPNLPQPQQLLHEYKGIFCPNKNFCIFSMRNYALWNSSLWFSKKTYHFL